LTTPLTTVGRHFKLGVNVAQNPIIKHASEVVEDTVEHAGERLENLPETARRQLDDLNLDVTSTAKRASEAARSAWKTIRTQVRQNPGAALGIAALFGFVLGFLVRGDD
jgi:ElaB/YqjD/DUF883 family membrane-anchored ribosome-binding protein